MSTSRLQGFRSSPTPISLFHRSLHSIRAKGWGIAASPSRCALSRSMPCLIGALSLRLAFLRALRPSLDWENGWCERPAIAASLADCPPAPAGRLGSLWPQNQPRGAVPRIAGGSDANGPFPWPWMDSSFLESVHCSLCKPNPSVFDADTGCHSHKTRM